MIKMLFGAVAATTVLAGANMAAAQPYDDYQSRSGYEQYPDQRGDYRSTYGDQHRWDSRDDGRHRDDQDGDGWSWGRQDRQSSYGGGPGWSRQDHYRRHVRHHARYGNRFDNGGYHNRDRRNQWNWEVRVSPGYDSDYYSGY